MPKLDDDQIRHVIAFANKLVWKNPDLDVLRNDGTTEYSEFSRILQDQLKSSHRRGKLILPDLTAFGCQIASKRDPSFAPNADPWIARG